MSIEVVSILVCSIGLVIAIPTTTALGVLVVRSGLRMPARVGGDADTAAEAVAVSSNNEGSAANSVPGASSVPRASSAPGAAQITAADSNTDDPPLTRRELRERERRSDFP